ncbi:MAG: PaaI family thioesterase [Methanomassiliicoccaceae archaeon]|nr:PaaI family thioesterase [Methanomassiliicoccaceae archaeon]
MNDDEIRECIDPSLREKYFERVKNIQSAPYSRLNNVIIESVNEKEVRTRMSLENKTNSLGYAHGAAVFAIADDTFAVAANLSGDMQIALSGNIIFHRPSVGKELTAVSSKINETRSVSTYEVKVSCDGKHTATATFVGFKIKGSIGE